MWVDWPCAKLARTLSTVAEAIWVTEVRGWWGWSCSMAGKVRVGRGSCGVVAMWT